MVADDPESFADLDGHLLNSIPDQREAEAPYDSAVAATEAAAQPQQQQQQAAQDMYKGGNEDQIFLQQEQAGEKREAQQAIDRGEPPNGEYSFVFGKSCPDCKYYPKEVVQAVDAHENQHAKDEHTLSGFFKLFTKSGRRELETKAFKAELAVEQRNTKGLEGVSQRTPMQEKTLVILRNMRDQAQAAIDFPQVYTP